MAAGRRSPAEIGQSPRKRNYTSPDLRTCSSHWFEIGIGSRTSAFDGSGEAEGGKRRPTAGSPSCQGCRRLTPVQILNRRRKLGMETAKLLHREGTNLPEGGRRLFAAPTRRFPCCSGDCSARSRCFSPFVDSDQQRLTPSACIALRRSRGGARLEAFELLLELSGEHEEEGWAWPYPFRFLPFNFWFLHPAPLLNQFLFN